MSSKYLVQQESPCTTEIYTAIKELKYAEAARILRFKLQISPKNRAALSLLAYCYYHMQDYHAAASMYETLTKYHGNIDEYKIYHAQSLYKAGLYNEALNVASDINISSKFKQRMLLLKSAIKYDLEDLSASKTFLDQCQQDDPQTLINYAGISFKEGNYKEARLKYVEALTTLGYEGYLAYNIALCYYKMKQYGPALQYIAEIIERGVREHPELSVGSNTDGIEVRSVGNSSVLQETFLIEAFNLKAAIEYTSLKNLEAAQEALTEMPPRNDEQLDPVTLHNQALIHMNERPTEGFKKLHYLLAHPPFPPEAFSNTLLLHLQYQHYELAADILVENAHLIHNFLPKDLYDYLDAYLMVGTSPEEAYRKFDDLTDYHIDQLRKLTKGIQDARLARDNDMIRQALKDYDQGLETFIPVLMAMARIYWERGHYSMVERIFRQSSEFCTEHEVWQLNVAHVFFMQETKWKDAIRYYELIVQRAQDDGGLFTDVPAIVLANLCVCYIVTGQNEVADDLMRKIEKEVDENARISLHNGKEKRASSKGGGSSSGGGGGCHLCIVGLVIGTFYCAKGNFEFGISRIIKSFEPYDQMLNPDTWYYAKRCFLALADNLAKQMLILRDACMSEILDFLDVMDVQGRNVISTTTTTTTYSRVHQESTTVSFEARQLKNLFLTFLQ